MSGETLAPSRALLPRMPEVVFRQFIQPHLAAYGWPFSERRTSVVGTKWERLFLGLDLELWRGFEWHEGWHSLDLRIFSPATKKRAIDILMLCSRGIQTEAANLQNVTDRFLACTRLLKEKSVAPPLVGISSGGKIELLDGHHRLAAMIALGLPAGSVFHIWLTFL